MNKVIEKKCCKCKEIKNKSEFHKRSSSKDGLVSQCKDCTKILKITYNLNYRKNQPKVYIDYDKLSISEKKCTRCNKTKNVREFHKNPRITKTNHGLRTYCKKCDLEQQRERRKKNKKFAWFIESGEIVTEKKCGICEESKPFNEFNPDFKSKYNLSGKCKSCRSIELKIHYKKNTSRYKKRCNSWRITNRDKIINSDAYMVIQLTKKTVLDKSDITPELIELKRKTLQLQREINKRK